ncbi:MAG TPA: amidohydrolase family protein [Myxococcota bacterium]|nr:amidohydrolase family protein [Myxococcota bacterium]
MAATLDEVRRDPSRAPNNLWRRETPGAAGWPRSARPGASNKYFMFSADCHAVEPSAYLEGIEPELRARIPRLEVREDGSEWLISEGNRPQRVKPARKHASADPTRDRSQGLPAAVPGGRMDDEDVLRNSTGRTVAERLAAHDADGIDAELMFPNKGLLCWATPDPAFAMAMCRQWNRWAHTFCGAHMQGDAPRILPAACIAAGDQPGALREIRWAAEHGFRAVCLGNSVIYGPKKFGELEYNHPSFEPMWALLEECGLAVTFHVSTGRDPRAVGGNGGAIINYVCHSMETTLEPLVQMIASGVFERHPRLRAGLVESGIGFVPWLIETLDYAAKAHHFWVRPRLRELPSTYFRNNCFATFQDDVAGLRYAEEFDLTRNLMWANDYPHHEGSWPHSAQAIERTMGHLSDDSRARILGENAARVFGLDPARYGRVVAAG